MKKAPNKSTLAYANANRPWEFYQDLFYDSLNWCKSAAPGKHKLRFRFKNLLDYIAWFPHALPGIILGLGLLWAVLGTPLLVPLYGSLAVLIVAASIGAMPTGIQITKSNLLQIGKDLEESGKVSGASFFQIYFRILFPILSPTIILIALLAFLSPARNVSTVALLATSKIRPLSLLQMDYMVDGTYEAAAVIGFFVIIMTTGVALIARWFGFNLNRMGR